MLSRLIALLPGADASRIERNGQGFYGLGRAARGALTRQAERERRSLVERWRALGHNEAAGWEERAAIAGGLLFDLESVADFGCGLMMLERHLPPGVSYHPLDIVARDARTTVCDLNTMPPPVLAEAAACLGLLEYLYDAPGFLRALADGYRVAVVSYNPIDLHRRGYDRAAHAWVNHYAATELESIFAANGWTVIRRRPAGARQLIWRLERTLSV